MNNFLADVANVIVNANAVYNSDGQVSHVLILVLIAYASASIVGIVASIKRLLLGREKIMIKE